MLTKELLRVRTRSGKVLPEFIAADAAAERALAEDLIDAAKQAVGSSYGVARTVLQDLTHGAVKSEAGLAKLVLDRLTVAEPDADIADQRWNIFVQAEFLRGTVAGRGEFQAAVSRAMDQDFAALGAGLYADLADARAVSTFDEIDAKALLQRYNTALVQGLLLRAESVDVKLKATTLAERRRIFRALRFHRLIPAVKVDGDLLTLELGGPLSLFGVANLYGVCIANFIPHVFSCPAWEIEAVVVVKNKRQTLKLDPKSGLVSHYRQTGSWIPKEFGAFAKAFAARYPDWEIGEWGEPLILGRGEWSLPDFSLKGPGGAAFYLELFHRWHAGALVGRVKNLAQFPRKDLLIGVCRQLAKSSEVAKVLENSESFNRHGLLFNEFPTPAAVMAVLKELVK